MPISPNHSKKAIKDLAAMEAWLFSRLSARAPETIAPRMRMPKYTFMMRCSALRAKMSHSEQPFRTNHKLLFHITVGLIHSAAGPQPKLTLMTLIDFGVGKRQRQAQ